MKTAEEFIKEINSSETLQNELKGIKDADALTDFLKKNDVDTQAEEFVKAFKEENESEGEIEDDDAQAAAGGRVLPFTDYDLKIILDMMSRKK